MRPADRNDLHVFIVAGEDSGDALGASLMRALRKERGTVRFSGVGGTAMATEGLTSLFPLTDLALFGFVQVALALRRVFARIRATADAVIAADPDVLVIIDSPDFTHRVARRVRARAPHIPIVDYVSPTVWAWRPGRARAMRHYVDHVMALLPFEPEAHRKLGGPPCTYVGHPAVEKLASLRPSADEAARRAASPPVLLVLPGSRKGEIARLAPVFGQALARLAAAHGPLDVVLPTLPHRRAQVTDAAANWEIKPRIVDTAEERHAAFRTARAALAASGTVTLELALAGVPLVAAYRVSVIEALLAHALISVPSVVLANLVLGEKVVPELLQRACTPERLEAALAPLLLDTPERRRQCEAFARLDALMQIEGAAPSHRAADIVLSAVR